MKNQRGAPKITPPKSNNTLLEKLDTSARSLGEPHTCSGQVRTREREEPTAWGLMQWRNPTAAKGAPPIVKVHMGTISPYRGREPAWQKPGLVTACRQLGNWQSSIQGGNVAPWKGSIALTASVAPQSPEAGTVHTSSDAQSVKKLTYSSKLILQALQLQLQQREIMVLSNRGAVHSPCQ